MINTLSFSFDNKKFYYIDVSSNLTSEVETTIRILFNILKAKQVRLLGAKDE